MSIAPNRYHSLTESTSGQLATLRTDLPDVMRAVSDLAKTATRDGALDKKTREPIALALVVAARYDACIGFQVQPLDLNLYRR